MLTALAPALCDQGEGGDGYVCLLGDEPTGNGRNLFAAIDCPDLRPSFRPSTSPPFDELTRCCRPYESARPPNAPSTFDVRRHCHDLKGVLSDPYRHARFSGTRAP